MAAIGCGWGRWLSAGAFAAKYSNNDYFLVGVEANLNILNGFKPTKRKQNKCRQMQVNPRRSCGLLWKLLVLCREIYKLVWAIHGN